MEFITKHWEEILLFVTSVMAIASQLAALTPTKSDDEAVGFLTKLFNFLAGNYGHAKNATK